MKNDRQYDHEQRPKSALPVGVTRLPRGDYDQDRLDDYLGSRGLSSLLARENGWYVSSQAGDAYPRVVIPCVNTKGYVYWQARAIDPDARRRYQSPSYSSSDSLAVVWPFWEERKYPLVAIVEGPMDALAAAEVGVTGVATMGKQPTDEQLAHIILLFHTYDLVVVPDKADIEAGSRTASILASKYGKFTRVVVPLAKDLAAMPIDRRRSFFDY